MYILVSQGQSVRCQDGRGGKREPDPVDSVLGTTVRLNAVITSSYTLASRPLARRVLIIPITSESHYYHLLHSSPINYA
ncbi:hypothetical protein J6590_059811 [Homalodisca vitripennis]|nr:hypothetical protein J6590_059811 [Homalodisca vitripennis]